MIFLWSKLKDKKLSNIATYHSFSTLDSMQACVEGGGGQGGHVPPQILADQKAPPAAAARRITSRPPRFLDFATCLSSKLLHTYYRNHTYQIWFMRRKAPQPWSF